MDIIKGIANVILIIIMAAFTILFFGICGWFLRWGLYLFFFIAQLFGNDWSIISWVMDHGTATWIICSLLSPFILLALCLEPNTEHSNAASDDDHSFLYYYTLFSLWK